MKKKLSTTEVVERIQTNQTLITEGLASLNSVGFITTGSKHIIAAQIEKNARDIAKLARKLKSQ
jgi:hypothetical protein